MRENQPTERVYYGDKPEPRDRPLYKRPAVWVLAAAGAGVVYLGATVFANGINETTSALTETPGTCFEGSENPRCATTTPSSATTTEASPATSAAPTTSETPATTSSPAPTTTTAASPSRTTAAPTTTQAPAPAPAPAPPAGPPAEVTVQVDLAKSAPGQCSIVGNGTPELAGLVGPYCDEQPGNANVARPTNGSSITIVCTTSGQEVTGGNGQTSSQWDVFIENGRYVTAPDVLLHAGRVACAPGENFTGAADAA